MMFLFCQLAPNRHFSDKDVKFSWRNFDAHLTTCPLKDYAGLFSFFCRFEDEIFL